MDGLDHPAVLSYHPPEMGLLPLAMAVVGGPFFLFLTFTQGGPIWFVLLWIAVMLWVSYDYLVRQARKVVVIRGVLFWSNYLTTEQVPLSEVTRIRGTLLSAIQVIECRDGRIFRIPVMWGYRKFAEGLRREYPDIPFELSPYARFLGWP